MKENDRPISRTTTLESQGNVDFRRRYPVRAESGRVLRTLRRWSVSTGPSHPDLGPS